MIRPLVLFPPALFVGLSLLFYFSMERSDPDNLPSTFIGQQAPKIELGPLGDAKLFDAGDLAAPGAKIVNFWASWCQPCRVEHSQLMDLQTTGLPIYGVNYKDEASAALGFMSEMGAPYQKMGQDKQGHMALDWGVYGVPESFIIDGQGRIVLRWAGPITARNLESDIKPALQKAALIAIEQ
ncbi:MAG: DsbE family thiol:disulfide interchange protein [Paracoccaceae bacterium]|jgi:cytochrome c biogenesis protein CcmG/thiol:disulfide interchange protein DsbE